MVVVTGITGFLSLALVGLFATSLKIQRNAQAINETMQTAHFSMDAMWRAIRLSSAFPSNPSGPSSIQFKNPEGTVATTYDLSSGKLRESRVPGSILFLTSDTFTIDRLQFIIRAGSIQPRVTIILGMYAKESPKQRIDLQTVVSLRRIDL